MKTQNVQDLVNLYGIVGHIRLWLVSAEKSASSNGLNKTGGLIREALEALTTEANAELGVSPRSKLREPGWYWVRVTDEWECGRWDGNGWSGPYNKDWPDHPFAEIDERRIMMIDP